MSESIKSVPTPHKHAGCKHFGLQFDQHGLCRKCMIRGTGALHNLQNSCNICVLWTDEDWLRYNSPLKPGKSEGNHSKDHKPKHKDRGSKSTGPSSTLVVAQKGGTPQVLVAPVTVSTVSPGTEKRLLGDAEPLASRSGPEYSHTGVLSAGRTQSSVVVDLPLVGNYPQMVPYGALMAPSTGLSVGGTSGDPSPPVLTPQTTTVVGSPAMVSTHAYGGPVTLTGAVNSIAGMGTQPPVYAGYMGNAGLPPHFYPNMYQYMPHGHQGQSPYGYPVQYGYPGAGYAAPPLATVASAVNVVHTTTGSISATGFIGNPGGLHHIPPVYGGPPAVPRHPRLVQMAAASASSGVPPSGHSTQSAPGGSGGSPPFTSSVPSPMQVDRSDEDEACAYSSSDSPSEEDIAQEDLDVDLSSTSQGLRAANISRIPAGKAASHTAISGFRSNLQLAMKYLPSEAFPPPATPAPQCSFTRSANVRPKTVEFLQFPPSEGFAKAFQAAQAKTMAHGNSFLGSERVNPGFAHSLAKYSGDKVVNQANYRPLTTLWHPSTKVQEDLAPLLKLPNNGSSLAAVKLPVNQSMFHQLELSTRAPLNVLSYMDWFSEASKNCLEAMQQQLAAVDPASQLDPNLLVAANLSKDLSSLLSQQRDMLEDILRLQVHSAAQVTVMRRDSYLSHLSPLVPPKSAVFLRSGNFLGPDLFEQSMVTKAVGQFERLKSNKQKESMASSMVAVAKATATKRHGGPPVKGGGGPAKKQRPSNPAPQKATYGKPQGGKVKGKPNQGVFPPPTGQQGKGKKYRKGNKRS